MADIASWNKHLFVVKPNLIQSFEDLSIKGSCKTEDKEKDKQTYVERKNGEAAEVSFTIALNALTGCKDVYGEAKSYVNEARAGAVDYFYLGSKKAINAKMMLTKAEIQEIVTLPGKGEKWVSCKVKITMKQASPNENEDGTSTSSSSGSGGPPWTAVYYYSGSSGAVNKVSATSNVSYKDALAKAQAKVPKNALWSGTKAQQATNQGPKMTEKALEAARARVQGKQASTEKVEKLGMSKWLQKTGQVVK